MTLSRRPPPPPVSAVDTTATGTVTAVNGREIAPALPGTAVEQPITSTANETPGVADTSSNTGPPVLDVKTNPELPSPARVRWMDAFSRVCAHLNQVRTERQTLLLLQLSGPSRGR